MPRRLRACVRPLLATALCLCAAALSRAATTPVFQVGTSGSDSAPYYQAYPFSAVPVGKTVVVPVVVSGTMTYSVKSSSHALLPMVKTGYPVMSIHVNYAGTSSTFSDLHVFTSGTDGAAPFGGGVLDAAGTTLYGVASAGGTNGFGTVYSLTTAGTFSTLYAFTSGSDGGAPFGSLAAASASVGGFYGTTGTGANGYGTIFHVTTTGSLSTLYAFTSGTDGANPYSGVVTGTDGFLYGTAANGGPNGHGTVYRVGTSGSGFQVLYAFTGASDGGDPRGGLVSGTDGAFYGTTIAGGTNDYGTFFKVIPPSSGTGTATFVPLHQFNGSTEGAHPYAGLIQGIDGNFYGTAMDGGSGAGTIFTVTSAGSLSPIHTFNGADGASPAAPLSQTADGTLYGTAVAGGGNNFGTLYSLTTDGTSFSVVHNFAGTDGSGPYGPLATGTDGTLYGAVSTGGTLASGSGQGAVYSALPGGLGAFSGRMRFALLRDMAPMAAGYVAGFAEAGYYSPTTSGSTTSNLDFFRVTDLSGGSGTPELIAQAGDPTNTGTGSVGFTFDNEKNASLIFTGNGQLAMANAGFNGYHGTNGAQFFITQQPARSLDFGYTLFGQMLDGFDVMSKIMAVPLTNGTAPVVPVQMDQVTVDQDNQDAVLLISAVAAGGGTISVNATDYNSGLKAVTQTGTTSTPGLAFAVTTYDDGTNDPPFLEPDADAYGAFRHGVSLPIRAVDLEFDYLTPSVFPLSNPISAGVTLSGNVAVVTPNASSPVGAVTVGLGVAQPFVTGTGIIDATQSNVYLGLGKLTAEPAFLTGSQGGLIGTGTGGTETVASFISSNPQSPPGNFTATINWGDGTPVSSGTANVSVVQGPRLPTEYQVVASGTAPHRYSQPGIYRVDVTVTGSSGVGLTIYNTAAISSTSSHIAAIGRNFTAVRGSFNGLVATFGYNLPNGAASFFNGTTLINWGDGAITPGLVRGGNNIFKIYGSHHYAAGTTYPVNVIIQSNQDTQINGFAWSTALVTGLATHQPPFPQSHIVGSLGSPGFSSNSLSEEVTLFNSGDLPSGPVVLQFYLSSNPDASVAGDTLLQIGNGYSYQTLSIAPGEAISGAVSNIFRPAGVSTRGKYLKMQVITSDPIGNHMPYARIFVDPTPLID